MSVASMTRTQAAVRLRCSDRSA